MQKYKKVLIILLIILICMIIVLFFKNEIFSFVWIKQYEHKYSNINLVEKNLHFNENKIEENNIKINDLQISLSDFAYNKNERKLDFNLKFENGNNINTVGYILRVYNNDYCLGDRFNGYTSLNSGIEYIINYNKFYEENFGYKSKTIDLVNGSSVENDLLSKCKMLKQDEMSEDGSLIHHISFELPEEFIINDVVKIELFDLNYQNIGNEEIYKIQEDLNQIRYTINLNEN